MGFALLYHIPPPDASILFSQAFLDAVQIIWRLFRFNAINTKNPLTTAAESGIVRAKKRKGGAAYVRHDGNTVDLCGFCRAGFLVLRSLRFLRLHGKGQCQRIGHRYVCGVLFCCIRRIRGDDSARADHCTRPGGDPTVDYGQSEACIRLLNTDDRMWLRGKRGAIFYYTRLSSRARAKAAPKNL